ncbi:MAG TPA: hypothetical protein VGE08_14675 [Steroidobacter sp.]|uniref:hypothetical protein n=1 Tax=Steroidobacter sp. TaxID=1978227 RepID=UPI002ED8F39A
METLETGLVEARQSFSIELEKLRDALKRSEDRYDASEKRALLEIDRERMAAAKAQKELAQVRQMNADLVERQRKEYASFQRELGDVRQNLGAAEGGLVKMRELVDLQTTRLEAMHEQLAHRAAEAALLRREVEHRDERIKAVEQLLQETTQAAGARGSSVTPKGRKRKASSEGLATSASVVRSVRRPRE